MAYEDHAIAVLLTALYLPSDRPLPYPRIRWPRIEALLRAQSADIGNAETLLCKAGFALESAALGAPGAVNRAEALLRAGRVVTAACPSYPLCWLQLLGGAAPPVLWKMGVLPEPPFITIVGTRKPTRAARAFAQELATLVVQKGAAVASGAALGIDRAAAKGALSADAAIPALVEVLPVGVELHAKARQCRLSAVAPRASFSSAAAMERNALLFALSPRSVVIEPRLRTGGAWLGAVECLRRKLSELFVYENYSPAARALAALGAHPILEPEELFRPVAPAQRAMVFGLGLSE